jgi:hypothetical protein
LQFGLKIGSSKFVKTSHFREKIQIFARMGDFLVQISQLPPKAKTAFRPLSESSFWGCPSRIFIAEGDEGFVLLTQNRAEVV